MDLEGAPIDPVISSRAGEEIDEDEEIQRLVNEANEAKLLPPTIHWNVASQVCSCALLKNRVKAVLVLIISFFSL